MQINGLELQIKKSMYNKTKVQPDGVTHIIDTSKQYPVYQVGIFKNYFDMDKSQVVDSLIQDLEGLVQQLKAIRCKDTQDKEVEL